LWNVVIPVNVACPFDSIVVPVPMCTVLENVVTPATLTLSKFVWPSTSKSPFASMLPVNVETPVTANPVVVVTPITLIPEEAVSNFFIPHNIIHLFRHL